MSVSDDISPAPAGKFMFEELAQRWHHIKHGEAQFTEPRLPMVKLYGEETVCKLLAGRDADKRRIAELEKWVRGVEESMISASDRAEVAEKRVAELEARALTVKLQQPLQVSVDFSLIRRALSNAGIAAPEIDEDLGSTHIRQIVKFVAEQEAN